MLFKVVVSVELFGSGSFAPSFAQRSAPSLTKNSPKKIDQADYSVRADLYVSSKMFFHPSWVASSHRCLFHNCLQCIRTDKCMSGYQKHCQLRMFRCSDMGFVRKGACLCSHLDSYCHHRDFELNWVKTSQYLGQQTFESKIFVTSGDTIVQTWICNVSIDILPYFWRLVLDRVLLFSVHGNGIHKFTTFVDSICYFERVPAICKGRSVEIVIWAVYMVMNSKFVPIRLWHLINGRDPSTRWFLKTCWRINRRGRWNHELQHSFPAFTLISIEI